MNIHLFIIMADISKYMNILEYGNHFIVGGKHVNTSVNEGHKHKLQKNNCSYHHDIILGKMWYHLEAHQIILIARVGWINYWQLRMRETDRITECVAKFWLNFQPS